MSNRVIKFRGKRIGNGQWVYGYYQHGDKAFIGASPYDIQYEVLPESIGQFTGLTDKVDEEIWEGDIVKCGYGTGKVIFHAGCFMVEWIDDKEANMEFVFSRKGTYSRENDEQFEVIGDIFSTPELLTQS